jgi:hypothetical protein
LRSDLETVPVRRGGPFRRTVFVVVIVIVVVAGGMGPVATTIGIERTGMRRSARVGDRSATDGAAPRHALRSGLGEQSPPRAPARPTGRSDRQNGPLLDPPASRSDHVCGQSAKKVRPTARARSRGPFSRCRDAPDEAAGVGPGQCANPPGAPVRVGLNPGWVQTAQPAANPTPADPTAPDCKKLPVRRRGPFSPTLVGEAGRLGLAAFERATIRPAIGSGRGIDGASAGSARIGGRGDLAHRARRTADSRG